jgi:multiple sugar transport system permease protein
MRRPLTKRIGRIALYIALAVVTLTWMLPYLWMVMTSLRDPSEPFSGGVFPSRLVLTNYAAALARSGLLMSFRNSFLVAGGASILALGLATFAGYGFSRFKFTGHGVLLVFLLIVKTLPGVLIAIAVFIIAGKLGMFNSHWTLVLVNAMLNLPFAIWNMRTVYDALSPELDEAAMIDGCSRVQAIFRVLLPVSLPGVVATFAFLFILSWNEYLFALTFISSPEKVLVPPAIASYIGQFAADYTGLITASVMASLPLGILFLLIQRYIVAGLSLGAVKG